MNRQLHKVVALTGLTLGSLGMVGAFNADAVLSSDPLHRSQIAQQQPPSFVESLNQTEWLLEDLNGEGVLDRVQVTIQFDGTNRFVGFGGCNRFFADVNWGNSTPPSEDASLSVSLIGATRRGCVPAVMNQESNYFTALTTAERVYREGEFLYIESTGTEMPLKFSLKAEETAPPASG